MTGEMLSGAFNHGVMIFAQTNDKLNIRIHLAGGNDQDGSFMLDGYVFMTASLALTISEELGYLSAGSIDIQVPSQYKVLR